MKFSEPVDLYSFDETTCFVEYDGTTLGGEYTILADSTHIMLMRPVEALQYSTDYTLHINGITDLKGNVLAAPHTSSFTTQEPDLIAPFVYDVIPADGLTQVDVTKPVKIFFNEPMNKSSAESGFSLMTSGSSPVSGDFDWDLENKEMTFTPDFSLLEGTAYIIDLTATVTDLSGNPMEQDTSFTFSTVDVAAPQIVYLGPGDESSGITVTTPVVAKFSEPLDLTTISSSSFYLTLTGETVPVNGTYEYLDDDRTIVFRPDQDLQFNESYSVYLTSDISDISNPKQFLTDIATTFITAPVVVLPHITAMSPPFGPIGAQTTIVGSGFDPVPSNNVVSFDGVPAIVSKATLESVTVHVPVNAESGPVTVTVNGVATDNFFDFDVSPPNTDPSYSLTARANTGSRTRAVVINPDAAMAYVTNWGDNTVTPIDISGDVPVPGDDIQVGVEPMDIALNPEYTLAYVTNFLSNTVSVIGTDQSDNATYHREAKVIPVGYHPYGVAVSSDKKVYVANNESEYVSVIDVDPSSGGFDHVIANVKTGSRNRSVVVTPDAGLVLVTGENGVAIIDRDPVSPTFNDVIARASAGSTTRHVAITPDAALALATTEDGVILIIDIYQPPTTQFGNVVASVKTGSSARNITISPDAQYVYITNPDDNTVSVYTMDYSIVPGYGASFNNPQGLELVATIDVDDDPYAIIADPNSEYILVTHDSDEGGVSKIGVEEASIDVIETLEELIASVQDARNERLIPNWLGGRLLLRLNSTMNNVNQDRLVLAIYNLDRFITLVERNLRWGRIPADLGEAWLEAAYKIREQLLIDLEEGNQLKGSGLTDSGDGSSNDLLGFGDDTLDPYMGKSLKLANVPNPFGDYTRINFVIPEIGKASIPVGMKVYNTSGQVVKTLVQMNMEPGRYSVLWNSDLDQGGLAPDGIYLLELRVPGERTTIRISVMR
jgi:YVTN family beta-propeller protein